MNPRFRALASICILIGVATALILLFPAAAAAAELAARELRYLWWLVLLIALAIWLIWAGTRRPKP